MDSVQPSSSVNQDSKDLEKILDFAWLVVSGWKKILVSTVIALIVGGIYAFLARPVYYAEAILMPKESQGAGSNTNFLSQLGGLGGFVGSTLGVGNATLERMEIIAGSRELAEEVITKYSLLPHLYPKSWDANAKTWLVKKGQTLKPDMRDASDMLRFGMLQLSTDPKKKIMRIGINAPDSTLAFDLTCHYVDALGQRIRRDIQVEADSNRAFLEEQLGRTSDPLMREKIQGLISVEIEKSMLANSNSLDVLEKPIVPNIRTKPQRKLILAFSGAVGALMGIILIIFGAAVPKLRRRLKMQGHPV